FQLKTILKQRLEHELYLLGWDGLGIPSNLRLNIEAIGVDPIRPADNLLPKKLTFRGPIGDHQQVSQRHIRHDISVAARTTSTALLFGYIPLDRRHFKRRFLTFRRS